MAEPRVCGDRPRASHEFCMRVYRVNLTPEKKRRKIARRAICLGRDFDFERQRFSGVSACIILFSPFGLCCFSPPSMFVCLHLSLSLCLCGCHSLIGARWHVCIYTYICLLVGRLVGLSDCLSVSVSLDLGLSPSLCLSVCLFLCVHARKCVYVSNCFPLLFYSFVARKMYLRPA